MRHRREQLRPQVKVLKADYAVSGIDGDMLHLTRRERCEVQRFLLDGPDSINRRMSPFGGDCLKYGDNGSVHRQSPSDFQSDHSPRYFNRPLRSVFPIVAPIIS
jgi:hypothetical protein